MKLNRLVKYSASAALAALACSTAWSQTAIPASFAQPKSAADTTAPGFVVRPVQATLVDGELGNTTVRAEAQLAGVLIDTVTGLPYTNILDTSLLNADGTYNEPGIISYNITGSPAYFPGMPSPTEPSNNSNIAMEAVAYLDLTAGTYSMIVNSDDGFKVTAGLDARDQLGSVLLGSYEGGRGSSDTIFGFTIATNGLYSFRLVYEQGGGDAVVDWYTADPADPTSRVHINDAGGVVAYRALKTAVPPYVSYAQPLPDAKDVSPSAPITVAISDGSPNAVNAASVALYFDGTKTASVATKTGKVATISYQPPTLLDALSVHTVKLIFADNAVTPNFRTNTYSFTVSAVGNIKLPTPIYLETFDEVAEGSLPDGWTVVNYTDPLTSGFDLMDPNSDAFLDWVCISRDTVIAIGAAGHWDANRRLTVREQYINGVRVAALVTNNFMYAESDQRGGNQVQYLFSKDYNLSAYTNVYISYHSIYEQNQDSMGSVEYSIDGGTNWQPIVYMLDGPDIVTDSKGVVDGYATLIAPQGDTAVYTDPVTGDAAGGYYGAFIGIQDTNRWASLGPYISARVNDDYTESKRVELFRLPLADKQKTVRLRFAQAGTGSWYFGVDDVGFYSISTVDAPKITAAPQSVSVITGFKAGFSAAASGLQLSYQWLHNGTNIPGANGTSYLINKTVASDAGTYAITVSNSGGSVTSTNALLTLLPSPEPVLGITNALVAHLKFDGDYTDASGNGVDGTAKGTGSTFPTFEAGVIGQGSHIINKRDGSLDEYVSLGYPDVLKFGDENTTDFSISFWVKQNEQNDDQALISNKDWNSSSNPGWGIFSQGGNQIRDNITGPSSATKLSVKPTAGLNDGAWHLVTTTVQRKGVINTYVDGSLNLSSPVTTVGSIDTDSLGFAVNIGQDGTGAYTDGGSAEIDFVIDDLGIWRRALTADEAAAIYLRGVSGHSFDVTPGVSTPVKLGTPAISGGNLNLSWTGGTAPFKVQSKASLTDAAWTDVTTTSNSTFSVPAAGAAGFYRIVGQ